MDGKSLSKMIREKKKGALRQDMDYAGQDAVDPNEAWDAKQAAEVNAALFQGAARHRRCAGSSYGRRQQSGGPGFALDQGKNAGAVPRA